MSTTVPIPAAPDRLTALVEAALGQSREVRTAVQVRTLPHLPPTRRGAAEHLVRRIDRGQLFDVHALHDLEALIHQLERLVEEKTREVFRPNECDPSQGHVERVRDAAATALAEAAGELRILHRGIAAVLNAVEALRIANRVAGEI